MHTLRAVAISVLLPMIVLAGPATRTDSPVNAAMTAAAAMDVWAWPSPAPHRVARPFVAPPSLYASGHRGVDIATQPGDPVFAPHDGTVSFAGVVVDRNVLSIMQSNEVITTLEPVDALVVAGDRVRTGQMIGVVATGGHCRSGCLHLGVRVHGRYVSPMLFLGNVPRAVLLASGAPLASGVSGAVLRRGGGRARSLL